MAVLFPDAIPRPTDNTPAVRAAALDEILKRVMEWFGKDAATQDPDEVRADLDDVCNGFSDAYAMARDLEQDHHWCGVNKALVDVMDDWSWVEHQAVSNAVRAWVKEIGLQPPHKLGDRVRCQRSRDVVEGEIVRINREDGTYVVRRDTDAPGCGAILAYEKVEVASATAP